MKHKEIMGHLNKIQNHCRNRTFVTFKFESSAILLFINPKICFELNKRYRLVLLVD